MLHSIYDLTTFCRKTTGDVPAKLVGASTTVVGSKLYLFGGRLVTERRMVSDLYVFDLKTFHWDRVSTFSEDDGPRARYFHSADTWNNQLIIFGGMSNQPDSQNPDELCVLNDVWFFDLSSRHWVPQPQLSIPTTDSAIPRARYAHLSSVTADRLFIIGGQDFFNTWLDDVCVYDLLGKVWVQRRDYPRHCGTYRSVAVSSELSVRLPQEEMRNSSSLHSGSSATISRSDDSATLVPLQEFTPSSSLVHLPYSAAPNEDYPSDIYLYSNYNFTDVKRELEVFSPLPDSDFTIQDRSSTMTGGTFPPGLRFPTGAILGTHLIIAGTYLAHSYQSFSIWVLDLLTMTWSRIDPGKAVESGSWFRGCLWAEANKFLIFGNRNGNLVEDYNRRLLSWDHIAVVDLEAFGIYQPPPLILDIRMQQLGLTTLEEFTLTDFDIICDDGRKLACSRKILEERWSWFKEQLKLFQCKAKAALEDLPSSPMDIELPELPGLTSTEESRLDPRLTPRSLFLSEPYPIALALLQYFYSLALLTPLQHAPAVLSQLLVLSTNYHIYHLESLVKHAMHRALSNSTSVGVYEVATLCSCRSLQIRALKTVMSYTQKRPSRTRADKENGGSNQPPDDGHGGNGPTDGGPGARTGVSRPRGTSDAKWRNTGDGSFGNHLHNARNAAQQSSSHPVLDVSISQKPIYEQAIIVQKDDDHYIVTKPAPSANTILLLPQSDKDQSVHNHITPPTTSIADIHSQSNVSHPIDEDFNHSHLQAPVPPHTSSQHPRSLSMTDIIDDETPLLTRSVSYSSLASSSSIPATPLTVAFTEDAHDSLEPVDGRSPYDATRSGSASDVEADIIVLKTDSVPMERKSNIFPMQGTTPLRSPVFPPLDTTSPTIFSRFRSKMRRDKEGIKTDSLGAPPSRHSIMNSYSELSTGSNEVK